MPFINQHQFAQIQGRLGWSLSQTVKFLQDIQCANRFRETWLPEEEQVMDVLVKNYTQEEKKESSMFVKISKILNRHYRGVRQHYNLLHHIVPSESKQQETIKHQMSKGAQKLHDLIRKHFGMYKIRTEYALPGTSYRLDFYLPQLRIAFEYDGKQHDAFVKHWHQTDHGLALQRKKDERKNKACARKGIQLLRFSWKDEVTQIDFKNKLNKINYGLSTQEDSCKNILVP